MAFRNILSLLFLSVLVGCSTVKYGKLYTMQEVLSVADDDCGDADARARAINWTVYGIQDLSNNRSYLEPGGEAYKQNRKLSRHLAMISSRRNGNVELLCERINLARNATDEFLQKNSALQFASAKGE